MREAVETDLRWRDAERHARLRTRARRHTGGALRAASGDDARRRALADYLHLYRDSPVVAPLLRQLHEAWTAADVTGSGPLREGDAEAVCALAARHGGASEAEAVRHWLARCPEGFEVFRRAGGAVAGYLLTLPLDALSSSDREADPVTAAAWGAVGPLLRAGERALLFRSWLDAEAGQGVSAVQSLVFARTVEHYLSTPALAVSLLLTRDPALWAPVFAFVGLSRWEHAEAPEASGGSAPGGASPAAFGADWRAVPPGAWLDALASGGAPAAPVPPRAVLGAEAFAEAVRDALRGYAKGHGLSENSLLDARVVREAEGEPVAALRDLLRAAAEELAGPRERRYFRALDLTYFRPAPTQAIAAERLELPFSTYRRHLARGVEHVTESLWRRETAG